MCQLCDLLFVVITFLCLSKLFNSIHVSFYLSKKLFRSNYVAQTFNIYNDVFFCLNTIEKSAQFYLYIRILVHDFNSKLDKAM